MNSSVPQDDSFDPAFSDSVAGSQPNAQQEPFMARPIEGRGPRTPIGPKLAQHHLQSQKWLLPIFLLLATCVSTFFAGAMSWEPQLLFSVFGTSGEAAQMAIRQLILRFAGQGVVYMFAVISILFAHEMGHYIATRIYKIPSTLPFFIPFPITPLGTMGAVIAMKGQQADRKEIFDIGIAGPLAGLVLAIPIVWIGVGQLDLSVASSGTYRYDLPLLVRWMYWLQHGSPVVTEVSSSQVNAMFMAGWVGLLITGLNMLPLSQLDGGHVTYTLFGSHSRWIARAFVGIAIAYMVFNQTIIWALMLILVFFIGIYHPPTSDDTVPLGTPRIVLGCVSLLIPVLCFPPRGLMMF